MGLFSKARGCVSINVLLGIFYETSAKPFCRSPLHICLRCKLNVKTFLYITAPYLSQMQVECKNFSVHHRSISTSDASLMSKLFCRSPLHTYLRCKLNVKGRHKKALVCRNIQGLLKADYFEKMQSW